MLPPLGSEPRRCFNQVFLHTSQKTDHPSFSVIRHFLPNPASIDRRAKYKIALRGHVSFSRHAFLRDL